MKIQVSGPECSPMWTVQKDESGRSICPTVDGQTGGHSTKSGRSFWINQSNKVDERKWKTGRSKIDKLDGPKVSNWTVSQYQIERFKSIKVGGSRISQKNISGPSTLSLLDRPLWPKTVHFRPDPFELWSARTISNFPSSFNFSNFSQNFPTAAKLSNFYETFHFQKNLSNFTKLFTT